MRELHVSRIREMTVDEVNLKIKDLREELFNLSFRNSMRQLDNPLKIREGRRDLARLMTALEEHRRGIRSLGQKEGATGAAEAAGSAKKSAKPKAKAAAKKKTAAKGKAAGKSKSPARAKAAGKTTRARTAGMAKSAGKTKSATRAK